MNINESGTILGLKISQTVAQTLLHVTKTNMAEGIQKRLQSEIEKYKGVQKGNEAQTVPLIIITSGKF